MNFPKCAEGVAHLIVIMTPAIHETHGAELFWQGIIIIYNTAGRTENKRKE